MLERVPASAESAGLFLLRHIERHNLSPLRSARALDPQFWRHGARDIDSPAWWSAYLQAVRVVPQSATAPSTTRPVTGAKYNLLKRNDHPLPKPRTYTKTAVPRQEVPTQADAGFPNPFFPAHTPENHLSANQQQHEDQAKTLDRAQAAFSNILQLADAAGDSDRDAAWSLFIRFDDQPRYASDMLDFLSRSISRRHMLRGNEAFRSIAPGQRSKRDYEAIIRLDLAAFRHRAAIDRAIEGTAQGFHPLPTLLAHFVSNHRWTAVAQLLQSYFETPINTGHKDRLHSPMDYLLQDCFSLRLLPTLAIELGNRLMDRKAVDAQRHNILVMLCRALLRRCVEHPETARLLTPDTMTAVFEVQSHYEHIPFYAHLITTLNKLPNRPAASSLALLAFRDWLKRFPDQIINTATFGTLIVMCDEARQSTNTYQYLIEQWRRCHGKPDIRAYQRILTACARLGDAQAVDRYFAMFQSDHGPPANLALLSPLIYVKALVGDAQGATDAFHRIRRDFDLVPNRVCWNMLMYAHFRAGDIGTSFDVFDDMVKAGIQPNSDSYGVLLAAAADLGDVDGVIALLREAREKTLEVTVPMLGCLVEAYLKDDNVNDARQIVVELSQSESPETLTRLWNSLLRHHALKGDYESVLQTQKRMRSFLVEPDEMTYATWLTTLTIMRQTKEASRLLQSVRSRPTTHITEFHYAIILHGYVREGNLESAKSTYHEMKEHFPDLNASARGSMLALKLTEDQKALASRSEKDSHFLLRYRDTLQYLASIVANVSDRDLASKLPGPGLRRSSPSQVLALQYLETVTASLIASGSHDDAQHFLASYDDIMEERSNFPLSATKLAMPLETVQMRLALQRDELDEVEMRWTRLFQRALRDVGPLDSQVRDRKPGLESYGTNAEDDVFSQRMLAVITSEPPNSVVASRRYVLSEPLGVFIEAMAKKEAHAELFKFLEGDFIRAGFRLSNPNVNKLVQTLCLAKSTSLRIRAFTIAEQMFQPDFDFEPWQLLRRGKMMLPKANPEARIRVVKRSQIWKHNPSVRVATYLTWNYLSYAFAEAQRRGEAGDRVEVQTLFSKTPQTVAFIEHPRGLKHHARGLLLRDSAARGKRIRQLEQSPEVQNGNDIGSPDWRDDGVISTWQEVRNQANKARAQQRAMKRAERGEMYNYKYVQPETRFRRIQEDWLSRPLAEDVQPKDQDVDTAAGDTATETQPSEEEVVDWTPHR